MDRQLGWKMRSESEEGYILISVLFVVSMTALLVSGLAIVLKNQHIQLRQMQYAYEAQSMIEISKTILEKELTKGKEVEIGTLCFNNGEVHIQKKLDGEYEFVAELSNNVFSKKQNRKVYLEEGKEENAP